MGEDRASAVRVLGGRSAPSSKSVGPASRAFSAEEGARSRPRTGSAGRWVGSLRLLSACRSRKLVHHPGHKNGGGDGSFWGNPTRRSRVAVVLGPRRPLHVLGHGRGVRRLDVRAGLCRRRGRRPAAHRHLAEDELFYVFEGSISFTMGDETRSIGPGEGAFVPRGTTHTYVNRSDTDARMIAVYTPSGMEGWFREVCTPVANESAPPPPVTPELIERMLAAGPRFNIEWVQ